MGSSTIFDDVLRTIQERRPKLLIPLVNEVFHETFPADTEVTRLPEEYQKVISKVVADSCNKLDDKIYHFECQSRKDGNMILRMVEYDFMIALVDSSRRGDTERIKFPRSCVIYLRTTATMSDEECLEIEMPDGQIIIYRVPVLKLRNYTIDEIFEKNLLILLPYYIINYEKKISKIATDSTRSNSLMQEYKEIVERLAKATQNDEIGTFQDIMQMMRELIHYLLRKQPELRERMGDVMGGKVLPLPSDKLREEREAGLKQGISQGISKSVFAVIETCQEYHGTKEEATLKLVEKFSLAKEEALALVEDHWR